VFGGGASGVAKGGAQRASPIHISGYATGRSPSPQRGPGAEAESFLYTFVQKRGQKVKDLNETIQSEICTFVLRN